MAAASRKWAWGGTPATVGLIHAEGIARRDRFLAPPSATGAYTYHHILLDSFARSEAESDMATGVLSFPLSRGRPVTPASRFIEIITDIENVAEIQIGTFYWPGAPALTLTTSGAATATVPRLDVPDVGVVSVPSAAELRQVYGGVVAIGIAEAASFGAAIGRGSGRSHFELQVLSGETATPVTGMDTIRIFPPTLPLSAITLRMFGPERPLSLSQDRFPLTAEVIGGSNVADPDKPVVRFVTPSAHGLVAGDQVVVTGFACADAAINAWVNRTWGLVVGYVASTTKFMTNSEIRCDGLGIVALDPIPLTSSATLYIIKNRIRIPISIKSLPSRV